MNEVRCIYCNEVIHPMRLEVLPKTKTCVSCSKEPKKAGRIVTKGQGEEIETNLEILDQETYRRITLVEKGYGINVDSDSSTEE